MENAAFIEGNTYKTVGGGFYKYIGKNAEGHDVFVRTKDGFTVEAFDARFKPDGLVAWGSTHGYPKRD